MSDTPNAGIPYVPEGTQDPAAGLNLALNVVDALLQVGVIDMNLTAPPGSPADGDLHIVGSSATGAWAGQDDNLARYVAAGAFWQFYVAGEQVQYLLNQDDGGFYKYAGGWVLAAGLGDAPVDGTGYVRKDAAWVPESGGGGGIESIVAGTGITVDDTDPANPIVAATATAPEWGDIVGTLADQTDLKAALDAKATPGIAQNSQSAAYTLVLGDANKHILHPSADTTARVFTIPANASVAFPIGTAVTFVNQNGAGVVTIAITSDTMRLAGSGATGSRALAANGMATALKITSTEWLISGTGLS